MIVEQFIRWLTVADTEQRVDALRTIVRAYFHAGIPDEEAEGVEAALTMLVEDPSLEVRVALAELIADEPRAPRHIVLDLAHDQPEVAALVCGRSTVLVDGELVDIVATAGPEVQIAVARRARVSAALAAALAEVADPRALTALAANTQAAIPLFSLQRMVDRFGEDADLRNAMLARPGLPIEVRLMLLSRLSDALHDLVRTHEWMGDERAEIITREARDKATVALAGTATPSEMATLVDHLRRSGQLTTALLLRAACRGNIRLLEEAFAVLAGVPVARVFALLADGRETTFRALYKKAGLPVRAYPAFAAALDVNRQLARDFGAIEADFNDDPRFARLLIERVLERYENSGPSSVNGDLDDLVVMLRRFAAEAARDTAKTYIRRSLADPQVVAEPAPMQITYAEPAEAYVPYVGPVECWPADMEPIEYDPAYLDDYEHARAA